MQQQLIENIIDITPATMDEVLSKIQSILSVIPLQEAALVNIVKSLFYGLWNFDKMINQHNLNTKISQLLLKIPKKNAILFFQYILSHLQQKWNLIDHHRINKFMQLVRYLLVNTFKFCEKYKVSKKKLDDIISQKVFSQQTAQNGLAYHIIDIYFQISEQNFPHGAGLEELSLFQELLRTHPNQHLRLYIIEHAYRRYKEKIFKNITNIEDLSAKIHQFAGRFLQLAKKQQKQLNRKNLYALVGYAKSQEMSFQKYITDKRQKALLEKQKKKKKITKSKKKQIKKLKKSRKQKKQKQGKAKKIMSLFKFQDKNRQKKGIEQL